MPAEAALLGGEGGGDWVKGTGASLQVASGRGSVPLTRYEEAAAYPHLLEKGMQCP